MQTNGLGRLKKLAGTPGSRCKGRPEGHRSEWANNCASCVEQTGMKWMNGSLRLALLQSHYINSVSLVCRRVWRGPAVASAAEPSSAQTRAGRSKTCVCICVVFLYQQTLPAEVLSAYSRTLLNKAWTLTFGVQSPMDWTLCQTVTPNLQLSTAKLLCKWVECVRLGPCSTVCEINVHRGRFMKKITFRSPRITPTLPASSFVSSGSLSRWGID